VRTTTEHVVGRKTTTGSPRKVHAYMLIRRFGHHKQSPRVYVRFHHEGQSCSVLRSSRLLSPLPRRLGPLQYLEGRARAPDFRPPALLLATGT